MTPRTRPPWAMPPGKISLVMDGQWGSTGKGKIAGYLALRDQPDISVCNFMTNAGHWFRSKQYGDFLVQQLPAAAVYQNTELMISAGAAITLDTFWKEVEQFEKAGLPIWDRLTIDPYAVIIEPRHKEIEAREVGYISSTLKGCGAALAEKVQRSKSVVLARDVPNLARFIGDVPRKLHLALRQGAVVMGELAQGFGLSLNHGFYPYVTSRDITPQAFLSDAGVPAQFLGNVYGVLRTFPIRVGNVLDIDSGRMIGYSGDIWPDQKELSWAEISAMTGKPTLERTTVTGKVRRVFSFSLMQVEQFFQVCHPTHIALNFVNYLPGIPEGMTAKMYTDWLATHASTGSAPAAQGLLDLVLAVEGRMPPGTKGVVMLGTGADNDDMIDLEQLGIAHDVLIPGELPDL